MGMIEPRHKLGKIIRDRRLAKGLTLKNLSGMTGLSIQKLSTYETSKSVGSFSNLKKIAAALEINVEDLLS